MLAGAFKTVLSPELMGIGSYFTLPSIGGLYTAKSIINQNNGVFTKILTNLFKIGIPIYADKYEEIGGNEISQQVLVGGIGSDAINSGNEASPGSDVAGALVKVADNIVVTPRTWKIHGYTGIDITKFNNVIGSTLSSGSTLGYQIHPAQTMFPALSMFRDLVTKFGIDVVNQVFKGFIQYIAEARRPFKFNTKDGETIPCLFKSYSVTSVAENQNFVELDLELQEFRFIALDNPTGDQKTIGGITGVFNTAKLGRAALKSIVF